MILKTGKTKKRPSWDAELVLDVLLLVVTASMVAVLLNGAGLI